MAKRRLPVNGAAGRSVPSNQASGRKQHGQERRKKRALRGRAGACRAGAAAGRGSTGQVRLWGRHAVEAALEEPRTPAPQAVGHARGASQSSTANCRPISRSNMPQAADLARLVARDAPHQGLVLECAPLEDVFLDEVLDGDPARPIVVLDQVTDPHNVGAILRSAAAFGACAIVTQDRHAPPECGVLAKSASGALEIVPWVRVVNLAARARGSWQRPDIGASGWPAKPTRRSPRHCPPGPLALVLGAEGEGLRENIAAHCDALARLPISTAMESLNVSNAAAIALYAVATRS